MKKIILLALLTLTASAMTYEEVCAMRVADVESNKASTKEEYSKLWTQKDNLEAIIKTCRVPNMNYFISELDLVNSALLKYSPQYGFVGEK